MATSARYECTYEGRNFEVEAESKANAVKAALALLVPEASKADLRAARKALEVRRVPKPKKTELFTCPVCDVGYARAEIVEHIRTEHRIGLKEN